MKAQKTDWKTEPLPPERESLSLDRHYSSDEFARIADGFVPQQMEDHWFIYYEEPWLHLHRSWTGYCIFSVRFERDGEGYVVAEALGNRNPKQVSTALADAALLGALVDSQAGRDVRQAFMD